MKIPKLYTDKLYAYGRSWTFVGMHYIINGIFKYRGLRSLSAKHDLVLLDRFRTIVYLSGNNETGIEKNAECWETP